MSKNRIKFANFRVSEEEKNLLEILARRERRTVSGFIRQILSEGFANQGEYFQDYSPKITFGDYQKNDSR